MARTFVKASNEYLSVDSTPVNAYPVTVAGWVYLTTETGGERIIWIGDKDAGNQFLVDMYAPYASGQPLWSQVYDGTAFHAESASNLPLNQWCHICGVYTSTILRAVFIDGGNKGTNNDSCNPTGADRISIGVSGDDSPSGYFQGNIGELAVWNVALSDAEVAILGLGYSPRFVRPQNLVAYWTLIRGLNDKVGGYNLTASGTVVSAHSMGIINPYSPLIPGVSALGGNISESMDVTLEMESTGTPKLTLPIVPLVEMESNITPKLTLPIAPVIEMEAGVQILIKMPVSAVVEMEATLSAILGLPISATVEVESTMPFGFKAPATALIETEAGVGISLILPISTTLEMEAVFNYLTTVGAVLYIEATGKSFKFTGEGKAFKFAGEDKAFKFIAKGEGHA